LTPYRGGQVIYSCRDTTIGFNFCFVYVVTHPKSYNRKTGGIKDSISTIILGFYKCALFPFVYLQLLLLGNMFGLEKNVIFEDVCSRKNGIFERVC
jgi:hypothetical protein